MKKSFNVFKPSFSFFAIILIVSFVFHIRSMPYKETIQNQNKKIESNTYKPSGKKRKISVDEYLFALKLFPREFPTRDEITITDDISPGDGKSYYVRPTVGALVGEGYIRMNMGNQYENCLNNPSLFAHELTHVWQIEHFSLAWYTKEFLQNQVFCRGDAYATDCNIKNKLADYNAEQQGVLVSRAYNRDACASNIIQRAVGTTTWSLMIGSSSRDMTVDAQGNLFLTNTAGIIYRYDGREWQQMAGSSGSSIAANGNRLILTNTGGSIFEWKNNVWAKLAGSDAKDVAVNNNGDVWMTNSVGKIYKLKANAWQQMPGSDARRIAAGGGQVWMVNSVGKIYSFNSASNKWTQMAGSDGRDITVSNDGKVFLTNTVGLIYQWSGSSWTQLDGTDGTTLAANNGKLILINTKGRIFKRAI